MKTKLKIKSLPLLCYFLNINKFQLQNIVKFFQKRCKKSYITTKKGKKRQVVSVTKEIKNYKEISSHYFIASTYMMPPTVGVKDAP